MSSEPEKELSKANGQWQEKQVELWSAEEADW